MTMNTVHKSNVGELECKLYKKRWLILLLFFIYAFNCGQQWGQFTIINNLVTKYYNVSATMVEWTATLFMLVYVILVLPSLYLIDKMGIRNTMIIGALGVAVGNWIKVYSVSPDRFYLVYVGQTLSASFIMMTFGLMGRFTAVWFGVDEISIATVLALLGDQLGGASSFLLPTTLVKDGPIEVIGDGLRNMHLIIASSSTVIAVLIILFFEEQPKKPPSISQAKQQQVEQEGIMKILARIFKKPSFMLFTISYGLSVASCVAIMTLLNELIVTNFPGSVNDAGNIGSSMLISGIVSSLIVGKILDKTRWFKETAVFLNICSSISMICFTWSLKSNNIPYVYAAAISLGFFIMGYYSTGIQLGIELTYPAPEQITTAISFLFAQGFTIIITVVYSYMIKTYGDFWSNIGMVVLHLIAMTAALFVPGDLKRQQAENEPRIGELKEFL